MCSLPSTMSNIEIDPLWQAKCDSKQYQSIILYRESIRNRKESFRIPESTRVIKEAVNITKLTELVNQVSLNQSNHMKHKNISRSISHSMPELPSMGTPLDSIKTSQIPIDSSHTENCSRIRKKLRKDAKHGIGSFSSNLSFTTFTSTGLLSSISLSVSTPPTFSTNDSYIQISTKHLMDTFSFSYTNKLNNDSDSK